MQESRQMWIDRNNIFELVNFFFRICNQHCCRFIIVVNSQEIGPEEALVNASSSWWRHIETSYYFLSSKVHVLGYKLNLSLLICLNWANVCVNDGWNYTRFVKRLFFAHSRYIPFKFEWGIPVISLFAGFPQSCGQDTSSCECIPGFVNWYLFTHVFLFCVLRISWLHQFCFRNGEVFCIFFSISGNV